MVPATENLFIDAFAAQRACGTLQPHRYSLGGSAIGSNGEIREMFHFAAKHAIIPMTEIYPMSDVNNVLTRLRQNHVRYRAVLANEL